MHCRDCATEIELEESTTVEREDGSFKYVCPDCAPEDDDVEVTV